MVNLSPEYNINIIVITEQWSISSVRDRTLSSFGTIRISPPNCALQFESVFPELNMTED